MTLDWVVVFFVLAIIAAALGFGGIAGQLAYIGKILFILFLILLVISWLRKSSGTKL